MKHIGVLSSGTDNSGVNGAIRAIVRSAGKSGVRVSGIKWGFPGLVENQLTSLMSRDVSGKIGKAGCFLGTGRPDDCFTDEKIDQMVKNIKKNNIEGLIVIGGDRSIRYSQKLIDAGIPIVAIPSTIQDDIAGTDICLGVDSACNNIIQCIERIRSCESSKERTFLVSVDGKRCGMLALRAAISSGAEVCLTPENSVEDVSEIAKTLAEASMTGKPQTIAVVSMGWKPGVEVLAQYLEKHMDETDLLVRSTILGYVQRGGAPTGFDRLLGTNFGSLALDTIIRGESGKMVALRNSEYTTVDFKDVIGHKRELDQKMLKLFDMTK